MAGFERQNNTLHEPTEGGLAGAKTEMELQIAEQKTKLQEAYSRIQQTEEQYRRIVENAGEGILITNPDGLIGFVNSRGAEQLGYTVSEMLGKPVLQFIDRNYKRKLLTELEKRKKGSIGSFEIKCQRKDGSTLWVRVNGTPIYDAKGQFSGSLGLLTDITEEKQLRDQLQHSNKRNTDVQEEERKRIAYELHDDTAQYLSILNLQLDSLLQSGKVDDSEAIKKLEYLKNDAERAFNDVRRFSHELRPVVLEHQGLQAALKQIAEDINKVQQISVKVEVEGIEPDLTEEAKLGLFRIVQEALNNTRKHAKASKAIVELHYRSDRVKMAVIDDGVGFDILEALNRTKEKGSLGLSSMQERAKLIGANLKIESQPGRGTTIKAELPLSAMRNIPVSPEITKLK